MSEQSTDWWLSNPESVTMPKLHIADYAESQGIAVPRRFATAEEAREFALSGGSVIMRSEHPEDYDGPSGLTESHILSLATVRAAQEVDAMFTVSNLEHEISNSQDRAVWSPASMGEPGTAQLTDLILRDAIEGIGETITINRLRRLERFSDKVSRYAMLTRRRTPQYLDALNYSYWEQVPGLNLTVVADSAIDDRYHIFGHSRNEAGRIENHVWHVSNEAGESVRSEDYHQLMSPDLLQNVVQTYETVRNLPRFDSNHCPLMELQVDLSGIIWFLQYHRSRDYKAADHELQDRDYPEAEGWHKADAVRGSISSPQTLEMALWYPKQYGYSWSEYPLPETEDASTDWHYNFGLTELLTRRRTSFITAYSLDDHYQALSVAHGPRSRWFKPVVAFACNDQGLSSFIPEEVTKAVSDSVHRKNIMARVVIDLATDGNIGFIRLNPEAEQPILTTN
jgi:hypothetical protein